MLDSLRDIAGERILASGRKGTLQEILKVEEKVMGLPQADESFAYHHKESIHSMVAAMMRNSSISAYDLKEYMVYSQTRPLTEEYSILRGMITGAILSHLPGEIIHFDGEGLTLDFAFNTARDVKTAMIENVNGYGIARLLRQKTDGYSILLLKNCCSRSPILCAKGKTMMIVDSSCFDTTTYSNPREYEIENIIAIRTDGDFLYRIGDYNGCKRKLFIDCVNRDYSSERFKSYAIHSEAHLEKSGYFTFKQRRDPQCLGFSSGSKVNAFIALSRQAFKDMRLAELQELADGTRGMDAYRTLEVGRKMTAIMRGWKDA